MVTPLISFVIPAYNYANTLPRAAISVLDQLDARSELIIINDGSTDDTALIIEQLHTKFPGRFLSICQKNSGLAAVRNRGINESRGQYLVFLDADDELVPGILQKIYIHIQEHPLSRLIIAGHYSIHPNGRQVERLPRDLPKTPLEWLRAYLIDKTVSVSNGACIMHRDVFALGHYPESFRNAEDIPVFAQIFGNFNCTVLPVPMAKIYKHADSLRHNTAYDINIGGALIEEVFDKNRLPETANVLRRKFTAQRYLSLFRNCAMAGDKKEAKRFYRQALKTDWYSIFRWSYTRKAVRLWLKS